MLKFRQIWHPGGVLARRTPFFIAQALFMFMGLTAIPPFTFAGHKEYIVYFDQKMVVEQKEIWISMPLEVFSGGFYNLKIGGLEGTWDIRIDGEKYRDLAGIYFEKSKNFYLASEKAAGLGCRDVGLKYDQYGNLMGTQREYLLWAVMDRTFDTFRIEHVNVENFSRRFEYPRGEFQPCAVIVTSPRRAQPVVNVSGRNYQLFKQYGRYVKLYK